MSRKVKTASSTTQEYALHFILQTVHMCDWKKNIDINSLWLSKPHCTWVMENQTLPSDWWDIFLDITVTISSVNAQRKASSSMQTPPSAVMSSSCIHGCSRSFGQQTNPFHLQEKKTPQWDLGMENREEDTPQVNGCVSYGPRRETWAWTPFSESAAHIVKFPPGTSEVWFLPPVCLWPTWSLF